MVRGEASDDEGKHDARFAEMEEGLDSIRDKQKTVKKSKAAKLKRKVANTGIVYMSRVPPHMKPNMLRQKLEAHGKVGKIYMVPTQTAPNDLKAELKARKTDYMKRSREFSEAWIEFEDKEEAEGIAQMLNCQPMGGKKRSRHSEDLWNLKFVPDIKWDDLMSEFTYQKKVKEAIFIKEIAKAKKERDSYLAEIDRAKKQKAILDRNKTNGFEIQEPDVYQYKQRKTESATVVDGTRKSAEQLGGSGTEEAQAGTAAHDGQNSDRVKGSKKKSREERRKLLGLDGDIEASVKAKPSTTISKDVLKMFAS